MFPPIELLALVVSDSPICIEDGGKKFTSHPFILLVKSQFCVKTNLLQLQMYPTKNFEARVWKRLYYMYKVWNKRVYPKIPSIGE